MPSSVAASPPRAPVWLLVLITISGTLAMHMFVPALPAAAQALGVDSAAMQRTISIYILGLAFGQLAYGPLSDGLGRRPLLLVGLSLYTVAGFCAAFAGGVHTLVLARLVQALGGCAGLALGRAIVRDGARLDDAVRDLALLNLMMMIGPGFAPLVGSLISEHLGWRAIFLVLASLGAVTLLCTWRLLPETSTPSGQVSAHALVRDYTQLLRSPVFLGFAIGGACMTTAIYAFIAAAPFIIGTELHRPLSEVGVYLGMLIVGMSVGNALTRRLIRTMSVDRLLLVGALLSIASALSLLAVVMAGGVSVAWIVGLVSLFAVGAGLASPAAMSRALSVDAHLVGAAAGLYGFGQMAVGALCTFAVGFGHDPAFSAAAVLSTSALIGLLGFGLGMSARRTREAQAQAMA
ncbi:Bcr/CflA subfamily drug resistance transporter [Pseudomonas sp. M47T1]|uniref:multidrug effflux MFS transporter n=1 Tax=Pseudomonas sp. M47T1 TaxID=1179778 RepID=UPI0002607569|nr:multidrug effflux MFS transporter [Pseudomonas sp. M47T1]EIK97100.1 Bcr/CflA subfamily drug resistance transporter [Pseudomonas sp. M47T1]